MFHWQFLPLFNIASGLASAGLRSRGVGAATLDAVRAPVGLDLGSDAPAEVAVSVLAEVMAVVRNRTGRPLRERPETAGDGL